MLLHSSNGYDGSSWARPKPESLTSVYVGETLLPDLSPAVTSRKLESGARVGVEPGGMPLGECPAVPVDIFSNPSVLCREAMLGQCHFDLVEAQIMDYILG